MSNFTRAFNRTMSEIRVWDTETGGVKFSPDFILLSIANSRLILDLLLTGL